MGDSFTPPFESVEYQHFIPVVQTVLTSVVADNGQKVADNLSWNVIDEFGQLALTWLDPEGIDRVGGAHGDERIHAAEHLVKREALLGRVVPAAV